MALYGLTGDVAFLGRLLTQFPDSERALEAALELGPVSTESLSVPQLCSFIASSQSLHERQIGVFLDESCLARSREKGFISPLSRRIWTSLG
jgi:hypothetical protein